MKKSFRTRMHNYVYNFFENLWQRKHDLQELPAAELCGDPDLLTAMAQMQKMIDTIFPYVEVYGADVAEWPFMVMIQFARDMNKFDK